MMKMILCASALLAVPVHALEVHEWGTFTVLSGTDGVQQPWYLPTLGVAKLPDFVHSKADGKDGTARIRMETPVIYFYPEKEMKVSVEAMFQNGEITETFPYGTQAPVDPNSQTSQHKATWSGSLHPPTDENASAHIPKIAPSANHEPYGAAREVPDAWVFESDLKQIPGLRKQPPLPEVDKFIFYRGVGNASLPFQARLTNDKVVFSRYSNEPIGCCVVLRVRGDKAGWAEIPFLNVSYDDNSPPPESTVALPAIDKPLGDIETELAAKWKSALAANGLTTAEASAMVETWCKTWFREEGDRLFSLMPRGSIDSMLPLNITPAPVKLERAFVARIEMISPEKEHALVQLLVEGNQPSEKRLGQLEAMKLGRFERGAAEIVSQIQANRLRNSYWGLAEFRAKQETQRR